MNKRMTTPLVAVLILLISGCANYTSPIVTYKPATTAERNFEALWQGSLEVLREYRFRIDLQDRRAGLITTRRMLGRHWFEFWRRDAVSGYDLAEGTLQTVYRRATVQIKRLENGDEFVPVVTVVILRSVSQGLEIVAASEAYEKFLDTADEDEYSRHKRRKKQKRAERKKRVLSGSVNEQAERLGEDGEELVEIANQEKLADKLTREIRSAAAVLLASYE